MLLKLLLIAWNCFLKLIFGTKEAAVLSVALSSTTTQGPTKKKGYLHSHTVGLSHGLFLVLIFHRHSIFNPSFGILVSLSRPLSKQSLLQAFVLLLHICFSCDRLRLSTGRASSTER
ncbi:hypothetical protein BDV26DRAFT_251036 [Aspergillus bertholletiae]|uniref:Secreted protein n=1 Tax=Aspergillus bertholletiae TaxID=1226010 RepID=A0A5N7BQ56_9EURO|nr:hypothetical protein BDV26DRAFT_251036 [Aspergillus bertholletiae]